VKNYKDIIGTCHVIKNSAIVFQRSNQRSLFRIRQILRASSRSCLSLSNSHSLNFTPFFACNMRATCTVSFVIITFSEEHKLQHSLTSIRMCALSTIRRLPRETNIRKTGVFLSAGERKEVAPAKFGFPQTLDNLRQWLALV
jgi:hypothetical protein